MKDPVLTAENLVLRYGHHIVVNHVNLAVEAGAIYGLLGHNGAGKTSTVEMLEGLRRPSEGTIHCCGIDVRRYPRTARKFMGIQLQKSAVFDQLSVRETLRLFAGISRTPWAVAEQLVAPLDLAAFSHRLVQDLSGGQFQQLALATAILNDPAVIFLDEPTTGLDPVARRGLWQVIRSLKDRGKAILLTTHYMEEAEVLCDTVGILKNGQLIVEGPPLDLTGTQAVMSFHLQNPGGLPNADDSLAHLPAVTKIDVGPDNTIRIWTKNPLETTAALRAWASHQDFTIHNLEIHRPALEDVFVQLIENPESTQTSS